MLKSALFSNPLRWYLAALLIGLLFSLFEPIPALKFQMQRFTQLVPAVALLLWSYRRQAGKAEALAPVSGWYSLGLIGFVAVSLVSGAFGPIPWISLGFVGVVLLQFSLLPLLRSAWNEHRADMTRILALFALAVLGIDVGILILDQSHNITPYAWIQRFSTPGDWQSAPYLFLNSRWANQVTVLVVWSFVPLLQQMQLGAIARLRWFWWTVALAVPMLAMLQIVLTRGDGAFLSVSFGTAALAVVGFRHAGSIRRLCWSAAGILLVSAGVAAGLSDLLDGGQFFGHLLERNATEFEPPSPQSAKRIVLWAAYSRSILSHPWLGMGIPSIAQGSPLCTPHNIVLALLQYSGVLGAGFALLLATGFVPRRLDLNNAAHVLALPVLCTLITYPLVDDLWLRPLALSVLLLLLPGLTSGDVQEKPWPQPAWLGHWSLTLQHYRQLALLGVLFISLSATLPAGAGFAPSPLVQASSVGRCLLLF